MFDKQLKHKVFADLISNQKKTGLLNLEQKIDRINSEIEQKEAAQTQAPDERTVFAQDVAELQQELKEKQGEYLQQYGKLQEYVATHSVDLTFKIDANTSNDQLLYGIVVDSPQFRDQSSKYALAAYLNSAVSASKGADHEQFANHYQLYKKVDGIVLETNKTTSDGEEYLASRLAFDTYKFGDSREVALLNTKFIPPRKGDVLSGLPYHPLPEFAGSELNAVEAALKKLNTVPSLNLNVRLDYVGGARQVA